MSEEKKYDFGTHEVLHLASILEDVIHRHLCDHPRIVENDEWFSLAASAAKRLQKLYQKIGATMP